MQMPMSRMINKAFINHLSPGLTTCMCMQSYCSVQNSRTVALNIRTFHSFCGIKTKVLKEFFNNTSNDDYWYDSSN